MRIQRTSPEGGSVESVAAEKSRAIDDDYLSHPIASGRGLRSFALVCVALAALGTYGQMQAGHGPSQASSQGQILQIYLSAIVGEGLLLFMVWRGVKAYGGTLLTLTGRWRKPRQAAIDLALGLPLAAALLGIDALIGRLTGPDNAGSVDTFLPRTPLEIGLWIVLALTAGIVEEIAFRGYLLRQLAYRLKSLPAAVIGQGLWFGAIHAYEGLHSVISICALGILFGIVALWRKNLWTNMMAHSCIDVLEGVLSRLA
jgi:membrane protease YdiL (CAAX protease family)